MPQMTEAAKVFRDLVAAKGLDYALNKLGEVTGKQGGPIAGLGLYEARNAFGSSPLTQAIARVNQGLTGGTPTRAEQPYSGVISHGEGAQFPLGVQMAAKLGSRTAQNVMSIPDIGGAVNFIRATGEPSGANPSGLGLDIIGRMAAQNPGVGFTQFISTPGTQGGYWALGRTWDLMQAEAARNYLKARTRGRR